MTLQDPIEGQTHQTPQKSHSYWASRAGSATATRWVQGGRPLPLSAPWSKPNPRDPKAGSLLRLASYFPPHFLFPPPELLPRHRAIGPGIRPQAPPAAVTRAPPAIGASQGWGWGGTRGSPARCEEEPRGARPPADARLSWVPPRGPPGLGRKELGGLALQPTGLRTKCSEQVRRLCTPFVEHKVVLHERSRSCSPSES